MLKGRKKSKLAKLSKAFARLFFGFEELDLKQQNALDLAVLSGSVMAVEILDVDVRTGWA